MSNAYWLSFAQYIEENQRPARLADLPLRMRRDYRYGVDVQAMPDLEFAPLVGLPVVARAIGRRFITPRGGLFYDLSYGTDLRRFLNLPDNPSNRFELETQAAREALKEPRIAGAEAQTEDWGPNAIRLRLQGALSDGPFDFIVDISEVSVGLFSRTP